MAIPRVNEDDEEVTTFKKNLRKMQALEEEAKKHEGKKKDKKMVSIRVEAYEGKKNESNKDMIKSKKKIFENTNEYHNIPNSKGIVKERVERLSDEKIEGIPPSVVDKGNSVWDKLQMIEKELGTGNSEECIEE